MKKFTADFETSTWEKDKTRVWAWATCEIGNEENLQIGNDIESFIDFVKNEKNCVCYFHNLKFDGEFIIYWLLTHNFKHVKDTKEAEDNTFTTLISDMGQFYSIIIYFKKGNKKTHKVTIYDSLKILPFSVDQIAKSFKLEISKLSIDYNKPRKIGHILTDEERNYIKNDVLIVAKALKTLFDDNLTKMTQGSNALNDYKLLLGDNKFLHYFPELDYDLDKELRKSYKGGFTYLSPEYKEKEVKNVISLDVNSLYPSVMYNEELPFGEPIFFEGEYKKDNIYNLYIQTITCSFEIKENKIPTIQIKNNKSYFRQNEYLRSSNNEIVCLVLTSIDLKLFLEQYNVFDLEYVCGWKFKSIKGIFQKYIDKWIQVKNEGTLTRKFRSKNKSKINVKFFVWKIFNKSRRPKQNTIFR